MSNDSDGVCVCVYSALLELCPKLTYEGRVTTLHTTLDPLAK